VDVLKKRHKWSEEDAQEFADFLLPMLDYDPRRRATAEQCLRHPWLQIRQRPSTSAAADPSSPSTSQQDSVEPAPEAMTPVLTPAVETAAADSVVMETKCDAAAETGKDDNVLPMTALTTVDANV